jgi:site-specific recombinase XerD
MANSTRSDDTSGPAPILDGAAARSAWISAIAPFTLMVSTTESGFVSRSKTTGHHVADKRVRELIRNLDAKLDARKHAAQAGESGSGVPVPVGRTVSDAIARFLATHGEIAQDGKFHGDSEYNTYRKYRSSLRFLSSFCNERRIVTLNDDMEDALQDYRRTRTIGGVTWKTERQLLITFFGFCVKRKWITTNPAKELSAPRNLKPNEVVPYTMQEECLILAACDQIGGGKYNRSGARYEQLRARAMVMLLRHTALRISDVCTLRKDAVSWDQEKNTWRVFLFTQKTGDPVFLPIPESLELVLDALPLPRNAEGLPLLFLERRYLQARRGRDAERTLASVFKKSGVKGAHAHRYRHTLATWLLGERGATFEQVADILGNSPEVVRKHYGKWSKGRQENIDRLMMAHFQSAAVTGQVTQKSHEKNGGCKLMKLREKNWCGEGDLNPHEIAPASTSS